MKRVVVVTTQEVEVAEMPKEVNQDLPLHNKEPKGRTARPEELEEDLVEPTEDLETTQVEAVDLEIVPPVNARAKLNEAAGSIDILKDRQFQ